MCLNVFESRIVELGFYLSSLQFRKFVLMDRALFSRELL